MSILAIDPGLENGVAVVDENRNLLLTTEIQVIGEGAGRRLQLYSFNDIIKQFHVTQAVIEDVSSMPHDAKPGLFKFGRAAGALEGALMALRVPTEPVRPPIWKRDMKLLEKSKEDVRALAIQTWPDMEHHFALKKHHNRAEAAMLGLWYLQYGRKRAAA